VNVGVRLAEITDGLSNTIMVGEKHVPRGYFGQGYLDSSAYNGDYPMCYTRGAGEGIGIAQSMDSLWWQFGSYHIAVCQFVMVDGSVHGIRKTIDPNVLNLLTVRNDGKPTPALD
jgi:hypothetical protein